MLEKKSVSELLALHAEILRELRHRKLIRGTNNPVADIAEYLVAKALNLDLEPKSTTGYDAIDQQKNRFEIKGRRVTRENKSRQLGFIRGLDQGHFTHLAGVLFTEDYEILRACVVPIAVVKEEAKYNKHVNGWRLVLRDEIWNRPEVRDITTELKTTLQGC